jgi:hypothetical protein
MLYSCCIGDDKVRPQTSQPYECSEVLSYLPLL